MILLGHARDVGVGEPLLNDEQVPGWIRLSNLSFVPRVTSVECRPSWVEHSRASDHKRRQEPWTKAFSLNTPSNEPLPGLNTSARAKSLTWAPVSEAYREAVPQACLHVTP